MIGFMAGEGEAGTLGFLPSSLTGPTQKVDLGIDSEAREICHLAYGIGVGTRGISIAGK
jgi:hypothetical protein